MKKSYIALLTIPILILITLTINARNGNILPGYGTLLNSLFPPKQLDYPIAQQILKQPQKVVTLPLNHKYPASYSLYLFIPPQYQDPNFPDIGPVRITLISNGYEIYSAQSNGSPISKNKKYGRVFSKYKFPRNTDDLKRINLQVEFLGDPSPLFQKGREVILTVEKAP